MNKLVNLVNKRMNMSIVHKVTSNESSEYTGVMFGGVLPDSMGKFHNPAGDELLLIASIDGDKINETLSKELFPKGRVFSILSTYSDNDYFLDDISFFGGGDELDYIKSGFTKVIASNSDEFSLSNGIDAEVNSVDLPEDAFPAFSFISDNIPNGLIGFEKLLDEYYFVAQFYSNDIPVKNGEAFYLSDANGYVFIKRDISNSSDAGLFFVQSA